MMRRRYRILATVTGVALVIALFLFVRESTRFDFEREALQMRRITTPPDGSASELSEFRRQAFSIDVSWFVTTQLAWNEYKAWFSKSCPPSFRVDGSGDKGTLRFRRTLDADTLVIEIEPVSNEPPLRVRVTFSGHAS